MAVQFNQNIRCLFAACFLNVSTSNTYAVTVYSGVQPSANTIISNWTSYNTSYLIHFQNTVLTSTNLETSMPIITLSTSPTSTAYNSGTGAWAILWPTNPSEGTIQGSSLPSSKIAVCDVSDIYGSGVVRFNSTSFTASSSYTITDFAMYFGGGIA